MNKWQKLHMGSLTFLILVLSWIVNDLLYKIKELRVDDISNKHRIEILEQDNEWCKGRIRHIEGVLIPAVFKRERLGFPLADGCECERGFGSSVLREPSGRELHIEQLVFERHRPDDVATGRC